MSKVVSAITFLFITLSFNNTWALPGERELVVDSVQQDGKLFTMKEVKAAAKEQRQMAQAICEGNREGIVSEQLQELMKVGLYNDCDKYSDEDKFCGCVNEISYKSKVSDKDLLEWKKKLLQTSKKNIALNSFKALKDYKELSFKEMGNLPSLTKYKKLEESFARKSCDSSKKLKKSISPTCTEDHLVELKESLSLAFKDCEDCEGIGIDSMPKINTTRGARTNGEDFLYYPTYLATEEHSKKIDSDEFFINRINKRLPKSQSKYTTIGDFQYRELIQDLATRIKDRWHSGKKSEINISQHLLKMDSKEKRKYAAFIMSMNEHFLFKDLPNLPKIGGRTLKTGNMLKMDVDEYLEYFDKIIPQGVFDKKELDVASIVKYLEGYLEDQFVNSFNKKCEELIEVLKQSCSAISDNDKLSFDLNKDSVEEVRSQYYPNEKFKVDQMYCASTQKSNIPNINIKSENIFDRNLLSFDEEGLMEFNFSSGVKLAVSDTLATGKNNWEVSMGMTDDSVIENSYKNLNSAIVEKETFDQEKLFPLSNSPLFMESEGGNEDSEDNFESTDDSSIGIIERARRSANGLVDVDELEKPKIDEISLPEVPKLKSSELSTFNIEEEAEKLAAMDDTVNTENTDSTQTSDSSPQASDVDSSNSLSEKNERMVQNPTGENFGTLPSNPDMNFSLPNNSFSSLNPNLNAKDFNNSNIEPTYQELMENRIKELEAKLSDNESLNNNEVSKVTGAGSTIESAFGKDEEENEDNIELNKLKLELEKMKLEMAKTELENKKKEATASSAAQSNNKQAVAEAPVDTKLSPLSRVSSNNSGSSKTKRSNSDTSSNSSSSTSSSVQASSESIQPISSAASAPAVEVSTGRSIASPVKTNSTGALLSATEVGDGQLQGPSSNNVVSYQNFSDISSAAQNELEKLYQEFGSQVITKGGEEILLEKDEATGEIKVIDKSKEKIAKIEKKINKRSPASSKEKAEKKKSRKRFSLQEFNQIIDNGVKEE